MENLLLALAVLACPVGMGMMMWMMMRGQRKPDGHARPAEGASLDELRAEQERLATAIDRLEGQNADSDRPHARTR